MPATVSSTTRATPCFPDPALTARRGDRHPPRHPTYGHLMTGSPPTTDTVEALVRRQLSQALGGRRGMAEAAVPTLTFTVVWLLTRHLEVALGASVGVAVVELAARLVQRQTV